MFTTNIKPYKLTAIITAWSAAKAAQRTADHRAGISYYTDAEKAAAKAAADAARAAYVAASAELREIIHAAEGRASVRLLSVDDIMDAIDSVPRCVLKKHLPGCEIHCDPNAQSFPHAYGYRPDSTHFSVVRRPAGWYLVRVIRDTCGTSHGQLVLTDGAKADIIAAAETL
mgnify:CR=1 FL=1